MGDIADRERFPDPAFNRWLDEGISDCGHTVRDAVVSLADAWDAWQSRPYYTGEQKVLDELSMLVRMFVHTHRKGAPGNTLCDRALDYLRRNGLEGSVLRGGAATAASTGDGE